MRIGIMLRHYEQHHGGVKIYTENLLPRLFQAGAVVGSGCGGRMGPQRQPA